ncbi:unnamed protein product [Chondrus crispus]|uniref:Uncharacterized protein n=1 Tax=Chondrus crispus TaxID=2769 RepID=R7QRM3_CHOCR|nr:unnamed protein product [Chondrus crispus]CDF39985.1 unnamed protein product [Chondrus crispus]|eukprot:XP_005710279.1 unnamed protein product [Chondrus crispus]
MHLARACGRRPKCHLQLACAAFIFLSLLFAAAGTPILASASRASVPEILADAIGPVASQGDTDPGESTSVSGSAAQPTMITVDNVGSTSTDPETDLEGMDVGTPPFFPSPSPMPIVETPIPPSPSEEPLPESSADADPSFSSLETDGGVTERMGGMSMAGVATAAVVCSVALILVCACCVRTRRRRRLANAALKSVDDDAHISTDFVHGFERRESIPWGHPTATPR